jgi:hypothetical protein
MVARLYPQALGPLSVAGGPVCYALTHKFEADRKQNIAPNSFSIICVCIPCRAGMNCPRVESHVTTDGQSTSQLQNNHLSAAHDQSSTIIRELRERRCGVLHSTKGWVRRPQPLPALASAVTRRFESCRTCDYIPPSQIREFTLRRLPRLAGKLWRQ